MFSGMNNQAYEFSIFVFNKKNVGMLNFQIKAEIIFLLIIWLSTGSTTLILRRSSLTISPFPFDKVPLTVAFGFFEHEKNINISREIYIQT